MFERFRSYPCRRICLHHHAVEFREAVEIGRILASVIARDDRQHFGRADSRTLALREIDIHPILGIIGVESRICCLYLRTSVEFLHELLAYLFQFVDIASDFILNIKFKTASHSITGYHGRSHCKDVCIGNLLCYSINHICYILCALSLFGTLVPRLQRQEKHTHRGSHARERPSSDTAGILYLRNLHQPLLKFRDGFVCLVERSPRWSVHTDHHRSGIFVGNETGFRIPHQNEQRSKANCNHSYTSPPTANEKQHSRFIPFEQSIECYRVRFSEPCVEARISNGRAHHHRAKCR